MELKVLNKQGKATAKKVKLNAEVFGIEPNDHAIYLDVKQYLANQRQGTHQSRERGEIIGSTRKIKKQKGTGTARAGSIKNPLFRGGGRVFGPRPRNYGFKLNNLKVDNDRTLFVASEKDQNTLLSSRNVKNTKVITADKLNTYDILNSAKLIISEKAVEQIENQFKA